MTFTLEELFKVKAHLGHLTRFREPKMAQFIFGVRNRMSIINLDETRKGLEKALQFLKEKSENPHSKILFVGTKRIAQAAIKEEATRAMVPYIDRRWIGGLLTNFRSTVNGSVKKLKEMEANQQNAGLEGVTKKEIRNLQRKQARLERGVGGIKDINGLFDVLFIVDVGYERIAVNEARKLKIPIVGIVDTNDSPEGIDYVIPANDDSMKAVEFYIRLAADAVLEGRKVAEARERAESIHKPDPVIKTVRKSMFGTKSEKDDSSRSVSGDGASI